MVGRKGENDKKTKYIGRCHLRVIFTGTKGKDDFLQSYSSYAFGLNCPVNGSLSMYIFTYKLNSNW
jgi:hypothetical protein